jgi:hypothetical protein
VKLLLCIALFANPKKPLALNTFPPSRGTKLMRTPPSDRDASTAPESIVTSWNAVMLGTAPALPPALVASEMPFCMIR